MGNCLPKLSKRNKVCPSPVTKQKEDENVSEILGRSMPFQRPSSEQQQDMMSQLRDVSGQDAKVSTGGLAFTVDFADGDPERMPSRLADRLDGALTPENKGTFKSEIEYTAEERELLAELMREDILQERRVNARREIKQYDAARRRAAFNMTHESRTMSALDKETPSLQERKQKVKAMADENRKKVKVVAPVAEVVAPVTDDTK